jgi:hypothetical protein
MCYHYVIGYLTFGAFTLGMSILVSPDYRPLGVSHSPTPLELLSRVIFWPFFAVFPLVHLVGFLWALVLCLLSPRWWLRPLW